MTKTKITNAEEYETLAIDLDKRARQIPKLMEKYGTRCLGLAYKILGNEQDAEEVVQDVFIRMTRTNKPFVARNRAKISTWLCRVTVNAARNKWRHNCSRVCLNNFSGRVISLQDLKNEERPLEYPGTFSRHEDRSVDSITPYIEVDLAELEARVVSALEQLNPVYRNPLIMSFVGEMSYEDISDVLNIRLGTVKSRIARARKELRKYI